MAVCCVQVVTVNCARIIHGNQVATNGIVHVIDRVISSVGSTIQDVLEVDDDLTTLSVSTHRGIKCNAPQGQTLPLQTLLQWWVTLGCMGVFTAM